MINDTITEAFKKLQPSSSNSNLSHQTDPQFNIPAHPAIDVPPHPDPNLVPQPNYSQSRNLYRHDDIPIPIIDKYDGQTDVLECLDDLETRFYLLPHLYTFDRLKVIAALESLAGPKDKQTDSPKQWARVELRFNKQLKDNWPDFKESIRQRYQDMEMRERLVEECQALNQFGITVQEYKQRFEKLCYQTELPKIVWGDEFYKGLTLAIKDKLATLAHLDTRDYSNITLHAIKFDEAYHARQREKLTEELLRDHYRASSTKISHHTYDNP